MSQSLLCQVLAAEPAVARRAEEARQAAISTLSKTSLFGGLERTYEVAREGGAALPRESKRVQERAPQVLNTVAVEMTERAGIALTREAANQIAKADILIHGQALMSGVPVGALLAFERLVQNWLTVVEQAPVLDPALEWADTDSAALYQAASVKTARVVDFKRPVVVVPPTDKHPAQTAMMEDRQLEGYWTSIQFSGALPQGVKDDLLLRGHILLIAIREARERANTTPAPSLRAGALFSYLLPSLSSQ